MAEEVLQVSRRTDSGFDGVAALVNPMRAVEADHLAGICHKLP
jgi:hypothetical protein